MDNSNYTLGTDLYLVNKGGNTITDWKALARWSRFVYLRASIGQVADVSFVEAANTAHAAGMLVGAYHELWPDLNLTFQADTFNAQIKSAGFPLDLPPAVAFEQQNISIKDRSVPTYPNPADLVGMASRVPDMIIYIGMDGLNTCKDAGFDFSKFRYWISEYMLHQTADGEYPIDGIIKNIAAFGITPDQLLFAQTADSLPYPPGISPDKGADYNRAVSFAIPSPNQPPAPPPAQTIVVTVQSSDMQTKIESVIEDGADKTSISNLIINAPVAPPVPAPVGEMWTLKTLEELDAANPKFNGSFAAIGGRSQRNTTTLDNATIQNLIWMIPDNKILWGWAAQPSYITVYINRKGNPGPVDWPLILIASVSDVGFVPAMRQKIRVLDRQKDNQVPSGESILVDAIPYQPDGNYLDYSPALHPEYWLPVWSAYKTGHYGPSHSIAGKDYTFLMPLLNPVSGWKMSKTAQGINGFWVDASVLHERV